MKLPFQGHKSCAICTISGVIVALILVGIFLGINFKSTKTVEIANGSIRGTRQTSLWKKVDFFAFRGIPYAKPPVGDLRLKVFFVEIKEYEESF